MYVELSVYLNKVMQYNCKSFLELLLEGILRALVKSLADQVTGHFIDGVHVFVCQSTLSLLYRSNLDKSCNNYL